MKVGPAGLRVAREARRVMRAQIFNYSFVDFVYLPANDQATITRSYAAADHHYDTLPLPANDTNVCRIPQMIHKFEPMTIFELLDRAGGYVTVSLFCSTVFITKILLLLTAIFR